MTFSPTSPVSLHTYLDTRERVHVTLPTLALPSEPRLVKKGVETAKPRGLAAAEEPQPHARLKPHPNRSSSALGADGLRACQWERAVLARVDV